MGLIDKLFGKSKKEENVENTEKTPLKIGIILGSVREERNAEAVANWTLNFARKREDANVEYELVDLADYPLPLLGAKVPEAQLQEAETAINGWKEKMASLDGYVFITPEYNHTVGGALKNAMDYVNPEVNNKVAGLVGYGSLGGARAHENMRLILGELQVADVRTAITFSLITDFKDMSEFQPANYHEANANEMFDQLIAWGTAFQALRK